MDTFPVHSICIRPEQIDHSFDTWKRYILPGYTYYIKENETCIRLIEYIMKQTDMIDKEKKLTHYIQHIFPIESHSYHILRYPLASANEPFLAQLLQAGASIQGYDLISRFPETPFLMYLVSFLQDCNNKNYESCLLLLLQNGSSFQEEIFEKYRIITFFTKEHIDIINRFISKHQEKIPEHQVRTWKKERLQRIFS